MRPIDLAGLRTLTAQLDKLGVAYALTGGVVVGFLLDNPALVDLRPTDDVDAITAVTSYAQSIDLEAGLRRLGFQHDASPTAPACRFLLEGIKVYVMPARDTTGRFNTRWFEHALATAQYRTWDGFSARTVDAPSFIATKLEAFADRGNRDWHSHDMEDIVTVVDGRRSLSEEVDQAAPPLRAFVRSEFQKMLGNPGFLDALPGHLPGDFASQQRFPILKARWQAIAAVSC